MKDWNASWKASKQPRKQRKYRATAPLHVQQKFLSAHLSKELRDKHKLRNIVLRSGDKIKVMRGQFKGHTGKVEDVDTKLGKVTVAGAEITKKDGNKVKRWFQASNLMITELKIDDKKRNNILERKK
jgi:large subunit ribosomal protein L24